MHRWQRINKLHHALLFGPLREFLTSSENSVLLTPYIAISSTLSPRIRRPVKYRLFSGSFDEPEQNMKGPENVAPENVAAREK